MLFQAAPAPKNDLLAPKYGYSLAVNIQKREARLIEKKLPPAVDFFQATYAIQRTLPKSMQTKFMAAKAVLSSNVAPGNIENWTTCREFKVNTIYLRPPYTPTDGGETQPPDSTFSPSIPENALGRVLLFIADGAYRGHGTKSVKSVHLKRYESHGCTRMGNMFVEASAKLLFENLPHASVKYYGGQPVSDKVANMDYDKLMQTKSSYEVKFRVPFTVRINYTCWEGKMRLAGDGLRMAILPDPYGWMAGKRPPEGCPFNENTPGNALTYGQFLRDLSASGIRFKPGTPDSEKKKLYASLCAQVTAFTSKAINVSKDGTGTVAIERENIALPHAGILKHAPKIPPAQPNPPPDAGTQKKQQPDKTQAALQR